MTIYQIKAELRRSACEDYSPWYGIDPDVFDESTKWKHPYKDCFGDMETDDLRTFFLLVAEAL